MAKNAGRPLIKLIPVNRESKGAGHFYMTDESKLKKCPDMMKFNPVTRVREMYKRAKAS